MSPVRVDAAAPAPSREGMHAPAVVREAVRSGGRPLDQPVRALMEARFQHDFGDVLVHTDARADRAAGRLGAKAFTAGRHVAFAPGSYAPHDEGGRRLLAHELAHVVQQSRHAPSLGLGVGRTTDAAEREAELAASGPGAHDVSARALTSVPGVQCFEAREHVFAGEAGPGSLSRAAGLLSGAEAELRRGQSAWSDLVALRQLWESEGGDPKALALLEQATNANDEGDYRGALGKVEQSTPIVLEWLRAHPQAGGPTTATIGGTAHPEAAGLVAADKAPELVLRKSGVKVSYAEVVALGDFYPSNEAMHNAPREELTNAQHKGVLDLIRTEVAGKPGFNFDVAYQKATQARDVVRYDRLGRKVESEGALAMGVPSSKEHGLSYTELAKTDLHFAVENRDTWQKGHAEAVRKAGQAAAEQNKDQRSVITNDAYTTNALADHFLTDAFAAGHLLYKAQFRKVAAGFVAQNHDAVLDAVASALVHDHRGTIFDLVAGKVQRVPVLGSIPIIGGLAGMVAGAFVWSLSLVLPGVIENQVKGVILGLERQQENLLVNVASKVAHDYYNTQGVDVANARGDRWRTFGDDHLRKSATTWQLLSLAVLRSRADVTEALQGRRPANLEEAWTYAPIAPTGFDEAATEVAGRLMLQKRHNPVADLMAKNLPMIFMEMDFKEAQKERASEAKGRQTRVNEYLKHLQTTGKIEDRHDSDDIARDIVATKDVYAPLPVRQKALLALEMLEGYTGKDDQRGILAIVRDMHDTGHLAEFLMLVPAGRLNSKLGGAELRELQTLLGAP